MDVKEKELVARVLAGDVSENDADRG